MPLERPIRSRTGNRVGLPWCGARRSAGRTPRKISRRSLLALVGLALGGAGRPTWAQEGTGLLLPVGDLARLVRRLLAARREGVRASRRVKLSDSSSGRQATLVVADDGGDTLALLITFLVQRRPLHVHTVSIALDDGESLYLELFRAPPRGRDDEEIVGAQLEPADLDRIASAAAVTVTARGWDETFTAQLGAKELEKIRRFAERRAEPADEDRR